MAILRIAFESEFSNTRIKHFKRWGGLRKDMKHVRKWTHSYISSHLGGPLPEKNIPAHRLPIFYIFLFICSSIPFSLNIPTLVMVSRFVSMFGLNESLLSNIAYLHLPIEGMASSRSYSHLIRALVTVHGGLPHSLIFSRAFRFPGIPP